MPKNILQLYFFEKLYKIIHIQYAKLFVKPLIIKKTSCH